MSTEAPGHVEIMNVAVAAGRMLLVMGGDLDLALENVERAVTLGPILEPTAYNRGGYQRLQQQREFLHAAVALRDVCRKYSPIEVGG